MCFRSIGILPACMHVYYIPSAWKTRSGHPFCETGFTDSSEPVGGFWKLNLGLPQNQQDLLTAEPSLQADLLSLNAHVLPVTTVILERYMQLHHPCRNLLHFMFSDK